MQSNQELSMDVCKAFQKNYQCDEVDELQNEGECIEINEEDLVTKKVEISKAEKKQIIQLMIEDLKNKNEFLQQDLFNQYIQILVISQITHDIVNGDPFYRHIINFVKAIKKSVRQLMTEAKIVTTKEQYNVKEQEIIKVFFQDINIGFITSTGQIKCTAFIYIKKEFADYFHNQVLMVPKKQRIRITLYFFNPNAIIRTSPPHQDFKTQFLRCNKLQNDFIILKKEISKMNEILYHVYKPVDDQIYFIKQITLQYLTYNLHFEDIFNYNLKYDPNQDLLRIHEAKLFSRITHPNVLRMYDWWLEQINFQTHLFMQFEYCTYNGFVSQAKNLLSYSYFYMNPMAPQLKIQQILEILKQIIDGLNYLQTNQIQAGELKPETILVTISIIGELQVFIADFSQKNTDSFQIQRSPTKKEITQSFDQQQYSLGSLILNLILTFPGDQRTRSDYVVKFNQIENLEYSIKILNDQANKVKNRHKDFSYACFKSLLDFVQKLLHSKFQNLQEIRTYLQIF